MLLGEVATERALRWRTPETAKRWQKEMDAKAADAAEGKEKEKKVAAAASTLAAAVQTCWAVVEAAAAAGAEPS